MRNRSWKISSMVCLVSAMMILTPVAVHAAGYEFSEIGVETSTSLVAKIDAPSATIHKAPIQSSPVVETVQRGSSYPVLDSGTSGWVKIDLGGESGYLRVTKNATLVEKTKEIVDKSVLARREVVNYALQFLGNSYVYGGIDPNRGADCSGFTRYVIKNTVGVSLSHSSTAQSREGNQVEVEQMRPGDLIFYGGTGYIDHVAMYIGNNQVVHASSVKTGIKLSPYNYRTPVKVVDVIGG